MDGTLFPGDDDLAIPATEFFSTTAAKKPEAKREAIVKADEDDNEETLKQRLTNLEKKITNVTTKFEQIEKCCKRNDEVLFRLENHAETLRAAMISLAKKIDVQTGRRPYE
ncbi:IMV surface protein [Vaccinia virus]|uniref:14k membrane protein n=2 Tax=Vaccinia virus TaxID=10245 RepID=O57232_VACCA|nr:14k membrane protein [Vaccinia virus]QOS44671.1 MVA138L [synthetic construct]AAT10536.1 IMV surface protein [Vaccinia virus]AUO38449.1 IMV surface protein [Vaccinia virus]QCI57167.1 IMV surface protein [Vaccinia virus]